MNHVRVQFRFSGDIPHKQGEVKMRKLVLFLHSSLDGYVEGPNGEMDIGWVSYDADLEKHAKRF